MALAEQGGRTDDGPLLAGPTDPDGNRQERNDIHCPGALPYACAPIGKTTDARSSVRQNARSGAGKSKGNEKTTNDLAFVNRSVGTASGNRTGEVRELNYEDRVLLWIKRHGAYPYEAAMYRLEDTVTLRFAINRQGKILYYKLVKRSKWYLLNRAIKRMMDRSSPVPPIPMEIARNEMTFTVPVRFHMLVRP